MRKLTHALILAGVVGLPGMMVVHSADAADAAEAASPHTFTGNVSLVSDYRFRGISQTYKQPAVQGGFDYSHASGLYLGTWASNVSGNQYANGAGMEWDFYGGYKWEAAKDLNLDVGLLYYYYPGAHYNNAQQTKYNNTELYFGGYYKWFSAKYSYTLSDFFGTNKDTFGGACQDGRTGDATDCFSADPGNSKGSGYLDLNANFEVADKTTLGLHVGHQSVHGYSKLNYNDYKISLSKDYGWATLGAAVVGTDATKGWYTVSEAGNAANYKKVGEPTLVLSIGKTF